MDEGTRQFLAALGDDGMAQKARQRRPVLPAAVGKRVRELRDARGWSQGILAMRAHCSVDTICGIENGRSRPLRKILEGLAAALGIALEQLTGEGEEAAAKDVNDGTGTRSCDVRTPHEAGGTG